MQIFLPAAHRGKKDSKKQARRVTRRKYHPRSITRNSMIRGKIYEIARIVPPTKTKKITTTRRRIPLSSFLHSSPHYRILFHRDRFISFKFQKIVHYHPRNYTHRRSLNDMRTRYNNGTLRATTRGFHPSEGRW